jgi:hypothetical protein
MVIILGDKACADTIGISSIVKGNFRDLFLTHPDTSDMQSLSFIGEVRQGFSLEI